MATLIKQVQGFVRGQNTGGKNGLAFVEKTIDHMFEHGDWTPLAWLVAKSDPSDARLYRAIIGRCVGGITMNAKSKEAKVQPSGLEIKMGENAGPTDLMPTLRKLVEDGESFRGKAVKEELLGKEPPAFDLAKYAKTIANRLAKEEVTVKDLMNAIINLDPK